MRRKTHLAMVGSNGVWSRTEETCSRREKKEKREIGGRDGRGNLRNKREKKNGGGRG